MMEGDCGSCGREMEAEAWVAVVRMTATVVCFAAHKTSFSYKIHSQSKAMESLVCSVIQKFILGLL